MVPEDILEKARAVAPQVTMENIRPLSGGFSSQAFLVTSDPAFVLLVARSGAVSAPNYGHAFVVLTMLERRGYRHAPTALWLSPDHTAIAISYFKGVSADRFEFASDANPLRLSIEFIDALLETASITQQEYRDTAAEHSVEPLPVETSADAAKSYGTDWFEIVRESCPDADIVSWLEPRINESVRMADAFSANEPKFSHGDPSNPNILLGDDRSFVLIDWDSARFQTVWAEYLIAYTTNLVDFMRPFRNELISHVSEKIAMQKGELENRVREYRRFAEVFDVNWSAMMMAKIARGESQEDMAKYRDLTRTRMASYESEFGTD